MELKKYINKKVTINLKNGFYYEGVVQTADDNSISIIDKNGNSIDLNEDSISFMKENSKW